MSGSNPCEVCGGTLGVWRRTWGGHVHSLCEVCGRLVMDGDWRAVASRVPAFSGTRMSQRGVYDGRYVAPYIVHTTVAVGGIQVFDAADALPDPFMCHTIRTRLSWRDRLRLLRAPLVDTEVRVNAPADVVEAVLELDADYRGATGSERRAEDGVSLARALGNIG